MSKRVDLILKLSQDNKNKKDVKRKLNFDNFIDETSELHEIFIYILK